jgi:hypothetical protein
MPKALEKYGVRISVVKGKNDQKIGLKKYWSSGIKG